MKLMIRAREFHCSGQGVSRRDFAMRSGMGLAGLALAHPAFGQVEARSALSLVRHSERGAAVRTAVGLLGRIDFGGRDLFIKGSYNSPDPFPATTHPDTLRVVVQLLRDSNCGKLILVERSGMGVTRDVWKQMALPDLARQLDLTLLALEDLPAGEWRKAELPPGSGWKDGIEAPAFLDRGTFVIQICNLRTHRFGGVFSASLKNSVGLMAKHGQINPGHNYMTELHESARQEAMIAEVNTLYAPKLIIMDATEVFTSGGPETGEIAAPGIVCAAADRLAMDAVGVAILRLEGSKGPISWRSVYEQGQLKRAAELKLGAFGPGAIRFLTADARSHMLASQIEAILEMPPKEK